MGGAMPIQISEIAAYCTICGFSEPSVCHDVMAMVQEMDGEWLEWAARRADAERRLQAIKPGAGNRGR